MEISFVVAWRSLLRHPSLLCGCKSFLQRCGLSRSHFYFLYLVRLFWKNLSRIRLFQITSLFSSLGVAVLEKSLKDATIPDHLSLFFTWCGFSRSLFPFLHLVRLLQITFSLPSLGAAILEKSLKDAVAFSCSEKIILS